jgi:hypothetical protein
MERCKICGAKMKIMQHPKLGEVYYFCEECEYISKDEGEFISLEEELKRYNKHQNSMKDVKYVAYLNKFLKEAVLNYTSEGTTGLDFGSGPVPVLAELLSSNYGYDMDIYDKFYAPLKIYENKKYDLITSIEVIEHLDNPILYFKLFRELLKEQGTISIMTQFHNCEEEYFWNWYYIRDKSHISFYTPKTMEKIGQMMGLKIVFTDHVHYTTFRMDK